VESGGAYCTNYESLGTASLQDCETKVLANSGCSGWMFYLSTNCYCGKVSDPCTSRTTYGAGLTLYSYGSGTKAISDVSYLGFQSLKASLGVEFSRNARSCHRYSYNYSYGFCEKVLNALIFFRAVTSTVKSFESPNFLPGCYVYSEKTFNAPILFRPVTSTVNNFRTP
jgi:hypothetical protein